MTALWALVEHCFALIRAAHLHRVVFHLRVVAVWARFLHCGALRLLATSCTEGCLSSLRRTAGAAQNCAGVLELLEPTSERAIVAGNHAVRGQQQNCPTRHAKVRWSGDNKIFRKIRPHLTRHNVTQNTCCRHQVLNLAQSLVTIEIRRTNLSSTLVGLPVQTRRHSSG